MDEDVQSSHSKDVERGEVLVNEKVLVIDETKPRQRRSLFHTKCKCEGKFCDVIVDGGSTDNLVSKEMQRSTPNSIKFLGCRMIIRSWLVSSVW